MKNDNGKNSSDKKQLFKEAFQNFKVLTQIEPKWLVM